MDLYSRNKLLFRIIILLIIFNFFTVGYLWWNGNSGSKEKEKKRDIENVAAILKKELNLSDIQEKQLRHIREDFFKKEKVLSSLIKEQRDSMNIMMFNENTDTIKLNNIARRVADNEYLMEMYRISQSIQLKKICNMQQLKKLQDVVIDIRDYFQPEGKKKK